MATSDPVRAFTDAARASTTKAQICLVDGWPLGGRDGLRVVLDPEEMLRVIETARPSLVYLDASTFDAEDEAGAANEALGMDEEPEAEVVAVFAELIRRSAKSNGDPTRSSVGFVCEADPPRRTEAKARCRSDGRRPVAEALDGNGSGCSRGEPPLSERPVSPAPAPREVESPKGGVAGRSVGRADTPPVATQTGCDRGSGNAALSLHT